MIELIRKTSSFGISSYLHEMLSGDLRHELIHLVLQCDSLGTIYKAALYISQISFVKCSMEISGGFNELSNTFSLGDWLDNAINLDSFIFSFQVWEEQDSVNRDFSRSEINQFPVRTLPNNMKFCFEPHTRKLKDNPTKLLFSSICNNMLWNNRETFFQWFSSKRLV